MIIMQYDVIIIKIIHTFVAKREKLQSSYLECQTSSVYNFMFTVSYQCVYSYESIIIQTRSISHFVIMHLLIVQCLYHNHKNAA